MQRSERSCGRVCTLQCVSDSRRPQTGTFWSLWQRVCQTVIWPWRVKKSLTQAVFSMRLWLLTWTNNSAGQSNIFQQGWLKVALFTFIEAHGEICSMRHFWFTLANRSGVKLVFSCCLSFSGWVLPDVKALSNTSNEPACCSRLQLRLSGTPLTSLADLNPKTHSKLIYKVPEWPEIPLKTLWTVIFVLSWGGSYNWPGCLLEATLWRYSKHLIWPSSWSFMKWWRTWQKGHRSDLAQLAAWLRAESVLMDGSAHQTFIFGASRTRREGINMSLLSATNFTLKSLLLERNTTLLQFFCVF